MATQIETSNEIESVEVLLPPVEGEFAGEADASLAVDKTGDADSRSGEEPTEQQKRGRWSNGVDWPVFAWIAFLHAGVLAAPFFFTWKAVGLFVGLWWITGGLGICLGYHRLLTHGSFQTSPFMRRLIAMFGLLAGEGSPLMWVATHRKHHAFSDQDGDPHSPKEGALWSHVLWLFPGDEEGSQDRLFNRYAPDLMKDPFMPFLHRTFMIWHWVLGFALFFTGWYFWNAYTGWSFVFWGIFLRLVFGLHATWLVNSATHMWGYRNYETTDDSRNLWWVAALTFGEGWHNNHHAAQRVAHYGHRWWEIDPTFYTIRLMEKLGLAWKVVDQIPQSTKKNAIG